MLNSLVIKILLGGIDMKSEKSLELRDDVRTEKLKRKEGMNGEEILKNVSFSLDRGDNFTFAFSSLLVSLKILSSSIHPSSHFENPL